jgi:hypothetical protein
MHLRQLTEAEGSVDANQPFLKMGCTDIVADPDPGSAAF